MLILDLIQEDRDQLRHSWNSLLQALSKETAARYRKDGRPEIKRGKKEEDREEWRESSLPVRLGVLSRRFTN